MSEQQMINDQKMNLANALDLHFWCDELNVRAEELKEIVGKVGPSLHDVRLYLSKKLLQSWPAAY